jgi:DNA ligase (NAD+)
MNLSRKRRILGKEITLTRSNRKKLLDICKSIQTKTKKRVKITLKKKNVKEPTVVLKMASPKKRSSPKKSPVALLPVATLPVATLLALAKQKPFPKVDKVDKFKQQGMSYLETLSQKELDEMLLLANDVYYNTKEPLMTDNEYDILKEYIMSKYPSDKAVLQVGAPVGKNKVKLPYEMWSMDKIKPDTGELAKWMTKYAGPYILSCKMDGVSGLYTTEGAKPKLYTRGDGQYGQDVSHLLSVLKLPLAKGIVVRGEFIIPKEIFTTKYAAAFANPRNLVSGIVNTKTVDAKTADVHFIAYECIIPDLKPSEQFARLEQLGFEVADYRTVPTVTNELLSEYLVDKRTNYTYEIDGIIVADDKIHPRTSGNPEHAFAFKMVLSDQKAEAKVVDVLWEPSKDGLLKPRVQIEPISLGGVTITFATGYNAKFIEDNKIGVGAVIELIRSGDVIPKIMSVIVPATSPKMPTEAYTWNATHVDAVIDDAGNNSVVQEKNIVAFFTELEVDGLKAGNIKKIMDAGFDTVPKILAMTKADFEKCGFKSTAEKYEANIKQKVSEADLVQLMSASGLMGRGIGTKKIGPILEAFPEILTSEESGDTKISKVKTIKGVELKTATTFVENIPRFVGFLSECGLASKLSSAPMEPSSKPTALVADIIPGPLNGKKIVMTKVRDKEIIEQLAKYGATLEDNIKKDTFVLIVKSKDDVSNKTKYAVEHNIPIMTPDEFKSIHLIHL